MLSSHIITHCAYFKQTLWKKMIIYEVNLTIDATIYTAFQIWLKQHVQEMLLFPGFIKASLLKPEDEEILGYEKLTVQYLLKDRKDLDHYFKEFALQMRADGINRFQDKFSATRRIFTVEKLS